MSVECWDRGHSVEYVLGSLEVGEVEADSDHEPEQVQDAVVMARCSLSFLQLCSK